MSREGEASRAAADAVARRSYGKLVSFLAARTRDVAAAEDALADAFASALADWPAHGVPLQPEAWLLTVARRRMIDAARRRRTAEEGAVELRLLADDIDSGASGAPIPDDRLRLMFACTHPAIDPGVRAPLMLQAILGFDAGTIASAFLIAPSTMSQRLVRAKNKIREAGVPFRIPEQSELAERLEAVLEAIYAIFAEGWSDPIGSDARRRNLADEGIWLGRLVVSLLPDAAEALGLLSLMLHAEARRAARRGPEGQYVPLAEQDPQTWNGALIDEAEALLARAAARKAPGRYQLEAAAQSVHAARRSTGLTDWAALIQIYDALSALTGSPVVAINRAIALSQVAGPAAGLEALARIDPDGRLATYQPYWAARAELLARTGEVRSAAEAYERAIGLESDPAVRNFLQQRRARLAAQGPDRG